MADTTFVNGVTLTDADWFNDVNRLQYTILSDPATGGAMGYNLINGLTADASPDASADYVMTLDASATTGKKVLTQYLGPIVLGTEQASTSGTSITFSSIPANIRRIIVNFVGVSTNGTDAWLIQLGDSGGVETTGYLSVGASISTTANTTLATASTAGFLINSASASTVMNGSVTINLENASTWTWAASGVLSSNATNLAHFTSGSKATSAATDRVVITTTGATNTFDAGAINISYQY